MCLIELDSWEQFPVQIERIRNKYSAHQDAGFVQRNLILFRGQANSEWGLKTTLERFSKISWTLRSYYGLALRCAPQIESFTEKNLQLPDWTEIEDKLVFNPDKIMIDIPSYDFWIYLRHHGFPSPLLDWSKSPYIAAFFAFEDPRDEEKASIFAYIERPQGTKAGTIGGPRITVKGPYIHAHRRHFLQQSWYSICTQRNNEDYEFIRHERVFDTSDDNQDVLIKITIPRTERIRALKYLNDYNVNSFSLMQTEDSLAKTLAFKELELNENL